MPRPPHAIISDHFREGNVVPFLGAGASIVGRPPNSVYDGRNPEKFLPSGSELAKWLADAISFPDDEPSSDLARVASYFQVQSSRETLTKYLRNAFRPDFPCSPIHKLVADMPKPMLIITTNYDDLLERAFLANKKKYHLVTHPESEEYANSVLWWKPDAPEPEMFTPSELPLKVDEHSVIYKMHGSIMKTPRSPDWESFVITEEDYVRFLSRMTLKEGVIPKRFMLHLRNSALLFLGYGLGDWNFRVMLDTLRRPVSEEAAKQPPPDDRPHPPARANEKRAWAIQNKTSEVDRFLWERRNVAIFNEDLATFAKGIRHWMRL